MRMLAALVLFGFAGSLSFAADKDEDKAKEAAVAFLKAVKAKDAGAALKVSDVPFLMLDRKPIVHEKTEDLKADLKAKFDTIKDVERVPTETGPLLDLPAVKKKLEKRKKDDIFKLVEKVAGAKGYLVTMRDPKGREEGALLVRIKDGTARVVGILD